MSSRINVYELSQRSKEILSRVSESRERYVIEERGTPIAAVVSLDDLARLEEITPQIKPSIAEALAALKEGDAIREMIRRERGGKPLPDSTKTIRYLRETRGKKFIRGKKRGKADLR